ISRPLLDSSTFASWRCSRPPMECKTTTTSRTGRSTITVLGRGSSISEEEPPFGGRKFKPDLDSFFPQT
ncbi:hypothetical protein PMAYCL1PPCAC_19325, partial [Pristionchus mayeri]